MNADHPSSTERLWTPWRMRYIAGSTRETGCIFCNRLNRSDDVESLILYRGTHSFVIMNLYPYNTGHIMLVPNQHASDLEELDRETLHEMSELLPILTRALRRAFGCDGFNVGLNLGAIAGAGVAAHLHQHIVPRWQGDANFMPIIANTMTIPELIPVTYAKIRAEMQREITGERSTSVVLLSADARFVLLHQGGLPTVTLERDVPILQSVATAFPSAVSEFALAGWAGSTVADASPGEPIALTVFGTVSEGLSDGWSMTWVEDVDSDTKSRAKIDRALEHLVSDS